MAYLKGTTTTDKGRLKLNNLPSTVSWCASSTHSNTGRNFDGWKAEPDYDPQVETADP